MKRLHHITTLLLICTALTAGARAEALRDYTWQLHHRDWPQMEATIRAAAAAGATEIQLSHGIIVAIDQINDSPETANLVNRAAELCDTLGLDTSVWAKELNIGENQISQDLDPEGGGKAMWEARQAAYRNAFEACPSVDRVVLQFGSCPTELWHIRSDVSDFNAATPCEARIALTIAQVKTVCDEYAKGLDVRTFNHSPGQQDCMQAGLKLGSGARAMIKEVPQDWQPYYPLNPLIGDIGGNTSYIEFDLGAEYWGRNKIPFPLVDYLAWRIREMMPKGISGVVVRVERGSDPVLGTLNEINVYAMSRLVQDPATPANVIYDSWFEALYGAEPGSDTSIALRGIYRDFFEAGRKMFYVRHHWALEKSSEIPDRLQSEMLVPKNLPQWNPDYRDDWMAMRKPDDALLAGIWQEKSEAIALIARAQEQFNAIQDEFDSDAGAALERALQDYTRYAPIWRAAVDAIFRTALFRRDKSPEQAAWLEADARVLEAQLESEALDLPLASKPRIASLVKDLRKRFPACEPADTSRFPLIPLPTLEPQSNGAVSVSYPFAGRVTVVKTSYQLPRWEDERTLVGQFSQIPSPAGYDSMRAVFTLEPGHRPLYLKFQQGKLESGEFWCFE